MTFDGQSYWQGPSEFHGTTFADVEAGRQARSLALLDAHIERMWMKLPEQSKRRLGCIAISTLVGVDADRHAELIGAFGLIAEDEGVLEEEAEFAETYLSTSWVCQAVAEYERIVATPGKEKLSRRREQTRLAVARYRERQRKADDKKNRKTVDASELRMEGVRRQKAIAVDGEGVSLPDGSHLYRYLAASTSDGTVLGELFDEDGIKTGAAINFFAELPKYDDEGVPYLGIFGYGFGYDLTKILERLKNKSIYDLFHSDDLKPKAVVGSCSLMLIGKCLELMDKSAAKGEKKTKIWDILKGFQSTFVKALKDWGVGTKAEWDRIEAMKKKRGTFAEESWEEVTGYCKDECRLLAQLVETYIRAHIDAGIDLRGKYHGAGSTSDAFLMLMNALDKRCTREVRALDLDAFSQTKSAFSRAFFGGRAEISTIGYVRAPAWTSDIASAYPHVLFDLPCVRHGKWRKVSGRGLKRALKTAKVAVVHFRIPMLDDRMAGSDVDRPELARLSEQVKPKRKKKQEPEEEPVAEIDRSIHERALMTGIFADASNVPWGPLPYRTDKGSIVFPASHPGGWAWLPEFQAAERLYPGVEAMEAWVLRGACQCDRPYQAIGQYYLLRIEWGKEGRGKVLKLGYNGCYGKFAQVIGKNPKYACRVVAGHITGTTRGRLFEGIMSAKDPWSVRYAATDGLISTEHLNPPNPPENDTAKHTKKWLGSWEVDEVLWEDKETGEKHREDLFVVQPGFYFSLVKKGRAKTRGTPLDVIYSFRDQILEQWEKQPTRKPKGLPKQPTFHGCKSSIRPPTEQEKAKGKAAYKRDPLYGRWTETDRRVNYVVNPKRSSLIDQGDRSYRLRTWWMRPEQPESHEYKKDPSFAGLDAINDDQPDYVEPLARGVGDMD